MNGGTAEEPIEASDIGSTPSTETAADLAVLPPEPVVSEVLPPEVEPTRRRRRALPWLIVLAALLVVAIAGGTFLFLQLRDANEALHGANLQIEQQQNQLQQQQDQLDKKESFGLSMGRLMEVLRQFDGVPTATIVSIEDVQSVVDAAWTDRASVNAMETHIADADATAADLQAKLAAAATQRDSNASGTLGESIIDARGDGFVRTVYDDASAICQNEKAIGCVISDEPFTVHLDAEEFGQPYTDDWARTLIADHEFAHVLQFTNPTPTDTALKAFGGDVEFMADCYALTEMNAWTLRHRVTTARYIYTVDYGYGRVCDAGQRDVIRTWISQLGYRYQPIAQQ